MSLTFKSKLTSSVAAIAITAFSGVANSAEKEKWTGAYAGVHMGAIMPKFDNNWNSDRSYYNNNPPYGNAPLNDVDDASLLYGFQAGYNKQLKSLVFGLEGRLSYSMLQNVTYYPSQNEISLPTNSERAELRIDGLGSVRARLGVAFGDFMADANLGIGYVRADFAASTSEDEPRSGVRDISVVPFVFGLGLGYKYNDNISIGIDASYYFIDEQTLLGSFGDGATNSMINFEEVVTSIAKIQYHF